MIRYLYLLFMCKFWAVLDDFCQKQIRLAKKRGKTN